MPSSILKPCANAGCPNLVVRGYCDVCSGQAYEAQRPTSTQRDYGARWRKVRDAFLAANPWCCDPYGRHKEKPVKAHQVDHKLPRKFGGTDDPSNLQGFCDSCHSIKTAKEDGGFGNHPKGRGGNKVLITSDINRAWERRESFSQCGEFS